MSPMPTGTENAELSERVGRQLADALRSRAETLEPALEARLASARAAALQAAQEARLAPELVPAAATAGAPSRESGRRWGLLLPAALLVLGLLALQHSQWLQQTLGLADRDTAVLRDDLPPNAYGDPGFTEYLDEKTEDGKPPADEDEAKR